MPIHPKTTHISAFKGLNNVELPEDTEVGFFKKIINADISKKSKVTKRKGYYLRDGGNYISLWASENNLGCYANKGGSLIKIDEGYNKEVLADNLDNYKVSFEEVDDTVYYTSPITTGRVVDGIRYDWGIDRNYLSPTLVQTVGTLPEGTYQVTFTYVNSDGLESGTSHASTITLPANSGISLFIPPHPSPNVVFARVYCSTQNGNMLYYSGFTTTNSTYIVSSQENLINPLITFNLDKPPTGQNVKYFKSRLFVASDNVLYYTEPFMYNHVNMAKNFFEFPSYIRGVMPVEDGIWVASDKLYYLSGVDPTSFKKTTKEYLEMVEGSEVRFSGSYLHLDNTPVGYKWFITTNLGIFVLFNQGLVINMSAASVNLDRADEGAAVFLQSKGLNGYLSMLRNNDKVANTSFGDMVETTIIRNGVVIP